jgi:hypothetical protein
MSRAPPRVVPVSNQTENPGGIAGWATDLMETMGAPGAGLAIALENLFPPLPSEIILPRAGVAARWWGRSRSTGWGRGWAGTGC